MHMKNPVISIYYGVFIFLLLFKESTYRSISSMISSVNPVVEKPPS
jgi:hypothetical protein